MNLRTRVCGIIFEFHSKKSISMSWETIDMVFVDICPCLKIQWLQGDGEMLGQMVGQGDEHVALLWLCDRYNEKSKTKTNNSIRQVIMEL